MPSFHIDLHAGRGQSEVDFLNGEIVRLAEHCGGLGGGEGIWSDLRGRVGQDIDQAALSRIGRPDQHDLSGPVAPHIVAVAAPGLTGLIDLFGQFRDLALDVALHVAADVPDGFGDLPQGVRPAEDVRVALREHPRVDRASGSRDGGEPVVCPSLNTSSVTYRWSSIQAAAPSSSSACGT